MISAPPDAALTWLAGIEQRQRDHLRELSRSWRPARLVAQFGRQRRGRYRWPATAGPSSAPLSAWPEVAKTVGYGALARRTWGSPPRRPD